MITKYAIKHLNGSVLKKVVCTSHADEIRDNKKSQALETKNTLINNLEEEFSERLSDQLKGVTKQAEIDAISEAVNTEKTARLSEINTVYDTVIQEADLNYNTEIAKIIPDGFTELDKLEFDKIDVKEYVTFNPTTGAISNKANRATLENTDLNKKRIADIKSEANKIIITRLPEWKQRNYTARMTELLLIMQTGTLTQAEQDELAFLQGEWNWVKDVRKASNDAESNGTLLENIVWPT